MLEALLQFSATGVVPAVFRPERPQDGESQENEIKTDDKAKPQDEFVKLPHRMEGNHLHRYSKVLEHNLGSSNPTTSSGFPVKIRPLPACQSLKWQTPQPLNLSAPSNLYKSQKLLSIGGLDAVGLLPPPALPANYWEEQDRNAADGLGKSGPLLEDEYEKANFPAFNLTTASFFFALMVGAYLLKLWCRKRWARFWAVKRVRRGEQAKNGEVSESTEILGATSPAGSSSSSSSSSSSRSSSAKRKRKPLAQRILQALPVKLSPGV